LDHPAHALLAAARNLPARERRLLPPRMAHTFEPGTRVRLVQDFQDLGGLLFRSGQLATVQGHLDGTSLVHFDGYEELEEEFRVKPVALGAADQAPWLAAVPTELLEPI
jgi:hypothetical protein